MSDGHKPEWLRRFGQEDLTASVVRVGLAAAGPIGAVIAEFATQLLPAQRLDRLHDYVEQLGQRLIGLEEAFQERLKSSAGYSALAEEASLVAVRSPSSERRRDLGALLHNGLGVAEAELDTQMMLLRVLENLNDAEIVILTYYGRVARLATDQALKSFREKHRGLFLEERPAVNATLDEDRRWAVYSNYLRQLEQRGLLQYLKEVRARRGPDDLVSPRPHPNMAITEFGVMLLSAIDRWVDAA